MVTLPLHAVDQTKSQGQPDSKGVERDSCFFLMGGTPGTRRPATRSPGSQFYRWSARNSHTPRSEFLQAYTVHIPPEAPNRSENFLPSHPSPLNPLWVGDAFRAAVKPLWVPRGKYHSMEYCGLSKENWEGGLRPEQAVPSKAAAQMSGAEEGRDRRGLLLKALQSSPCPKALGKSFLIVKTRKPATARNQVFFKIPRLSMSQLVTWSKLC